MVPVPITSRYPHSSRLLYLLLSLGTQHAPRILRRSRGLVDDPADVGQILAKRRTDFDPHEPKFVVFAALIPILVLMSGLFAGLTLGYMSLDETQLNVLSISGTPDQKKYANKIKPIRKNGHLLLVTLLLANMIVNESLPVIADPVLGGGLQSVVVSTVLIVIFAEIIPQSLFTRHGLFLGAKLAGFTKFLIYFLGIIAWPVAKLLELALGPHHGIIYRRAELKELIAMHDADAIHGGDLKPDTVAIIGATLDLQEKVVQQAMTPIDDVFMLSIDSKLDYALLKQICETGHSRVPVYEEIDVPVSVAARTSESVPSKEKAQKTLKVKKIIGILLVKHCVLLDPSDATPLRQVPLNKVPFVPKNGPLLGILDVFQEGRSHMAIVSRFSVDKAASVKKAVKRGLTQRLRERVGMGDSDSDSDDEKAVSSPKKASSKSKIMDRLRVRDIEEGTEDASTLKDEATVGPCAEEYTTEKTVEVDQTKGEIKRSNTNKSNKDDPFKKHKLTGFQLPKVASGMTSMSALEQSMPADAVLAKEGAAEFLQGFEPAVMPLGIITLEDVLEELIGEEIYDEFDSEGALGEPHAYEKSPVPQVTNGPPEARPPSRQSHGGTNLYGHGPNVAKSSTTTLGVHMPNALKGLGFMRARSAPPRDSEGETDFSIQQEILKATNNRDDVVPLLSGMGGTLPALQMPKPVRSPGRSPPSVILEQHSGIPSYDSDFVQERLTSDITVDGRSHLPPLPTSSTPNALAQLTPAALPQSSSVPPSMNPTTAVPGAPHVSASSRSGSPSIEAILLERKRRLMSGTAGSGGHSHSGSPITSPGTMSPGSSQTPASLPPIPATPVSAAVSGAPSNLVLSRALHSSAGKGARFKSSPLGGEIAGGVVPEQLKAKEQSTEAGHLKEGRERISMDAHRIGGEKPEGREGA